MDDNRYCTKNELPHDWIRKNSCDHRFHKVTPREMAVHWSESIKKMFSVSARMAKSMLLADTLLQLVYSNPGLQTWVQLIIDNEVSWTAEMHVG